MTEEFYLNIRTWRMRSALLASVIQVAVSRKGIIMKKLLATIGFSALAFALASCGQGSQPSPSNRQDASSGTAATAASSSSDRLLAAGEPFEMLTEIAFTAPLTEIDKKIVEARSAVNSIHSLLSPTESVNADIMFTNIEQSRKRNDRTGLALASIEIYRGIVSSVAPGTKIPAAVSLLDYAGFRYQADLKATPARWTDMGEAMVYARSQWPGVASALNDPSLSASFEKSLVNMEKAVADKNAALAASAVKEELNLVDKLEISFARRRP